MGVFVPPPPPPYHVYIGHVFMVISRWLHIVHMTQNRIGYQRQDSTHCLAMYGTCPNAKRVSWQEIPVLLVKSLTYNHQPQWHNQSTRVRNAISGALPMTKFHAQIRKILTYTWKFETAEALNRHV